MLSSPGQWGYQEGKGPIECRAILPWHLIKGIKAWEAKPTGYPPGSIPSSYQKHKSSKRLNFPILEVFWSEPSGLFLGKRSVLVMFVLACLGGNTSVQAVVLQWRPESIGLNAVWSITPGSCRSKPEENLIWLCCAFSGAVYLLKWTKTLEASCQ